MQGSYVSDSRIHDSDRLRELQSLSLEQKIAITQARIIEWFNFWEGDVYVSFSGGKDSTVLLDLVKKTLAAIDPTFELPVVFSNTGLEYPEIQKFAKSKNATFVTPKMNFVNVIKNYGYPLISKEVANAIYYARRIRPYNENNENAVGCDTHTHTDTERGYKETTFKRTELLGTRTGSRRTETVQPPQRGSRQQTESDQSCLTEESTRATTTKNRQELQQRRIDKSYNNTDSCCTGELQTKTAPWDSG